MSETKHTPGPWFRDGQTVYALTEKRVNRFCAHVMDAHTGREELVATARLIAAAPDLLETLRKMAEHPTGGVGCNPVGFVKEARAAIRKATEG